MKTATLKASSISQTAKIADASVIKTGSALNSDASFVAYNSTPIKVVTSIDGDVGAASLQHLNKNLNEVHGGSNGNDFMMGTAQSDRIHGGYYGYDWLIGGEGDDVLIAMSNGNAWKGQGVDTGGVNCSLLEGGNGKDMLIVTNQATGSFVLKGEAGNDTIWVKGGDYLQLWGGESTETASSNDLFRFDADFRGYAEIRDFDRSDLQKSWDFIQIDDRDGNKNDDDFTITYGSSGATIDLEGGGRIFVLGADQNSLDWML